MEKTKARAKRTWRHMADMSSTPTEYWCLLLNQATLCLEILMTLTWIVSLLWKQLYKLLVLFSSGLKIGIAGFWSITSIHFNNIRQKHHAVIHCRICPINVVIATAQAMFASLVIMWARSNRSLLDIEISSKDGQCVVSSFSSVRLGTHDDYRLKKIL